MVTNGNKTSYVDGLISDKNVPITYGTSGSATGNLKDNAYVDSVTWNTNSVPNVETSKSKTEYTATIKFKDNSTQTIKIPVSVIGGTAKTNITMTYGDAALVASDQITNKSTLATDFSVTNADISWASDSTGTPLATDFWKTAGTNKQAYLIIKYNDGTSQAISAPVTINPKAATANLGGNGDKVYNTEPANVSIDTLKDLHNWTATGLVNGSTLNLSDLTMSDFDWYEGNIKLTAAPKNVGTYTIKLNNTGVTALKNANKNYNFDDNGISGSYTYTIKQADASAELSGNNSKAYDGSPVTTAELLNSNGDVKVELTFPGSTSENDTYTLQNGDYTWNTSDGSAPKDQGSYTITLTSRGITNIENKIKAAVGTGTDSSGHTISNVKFADNAISGSATYTIGKMGVKIVFSDTKKNKDVNYGTQDWLDAKDSINNEKASYSVSVTTNPTEGTGTTVDLPNNFSWNDGDLAYETTPGNVGTYNVKLTDQGLTHLETTLGNNYAYPAAVIDHGTLTVKQGTITINLGGSDEKTYNASATSSADLTPSKYSYTGTIYKNDGTPQTLTLSAADLSLEGGSQTNVGTYTVDWSEAGKTALKSLDGNSGNNYAWTFNRTADYQIKQADASAELSGSNSKPYDGHAVTTAELLNSNGNVKVVLHYPGSTDASTYTLAAGDYTWNTSDSSAPKDQGSYTITLTSRGITNIENQIKAAVGTGTDSTGNTISNVKFADNAVTGSAGFTINPKAATANLGGGDSKTYNTEPANVSIDTLKDIRNWTATGLVNGSTLNLSGLTLSDFDWYEGNTKLDAAPTDAGDYTIRLNDNGVNAIKNANRDYSFAANAISGSYGYRITKATATATLSGDQEDVYRGSAYGNNDLHTGAYQVTLSNGKSYTLQAGDLQFAAGEDPINAGMYHVELTSRGKNNIASVARNNYNYDFSHVGQGTFKITPAAAQIVINGSPTSTTADIVPSNFSGQVDEYLGRPTVSGNPSSHFAIDINAGDLTYVDSQGNPTTVPTHPGDYSIGLTNAALARLQSDPAYKNYKIGRGTVGTFHLEGTINYIFQDSDEDNRQVGSAIVKTGLPSEGVKNTDLVVPAGYNLVNGQTLPNTYSIKTTDPLTQNVVIKLKHATITVNPGQEAPTGPVPGDPSKNYETMNNLTSTPTRTIKMTYPDGSHGQLVQKVSFSRTATFDEVTGKAAYSDWTLTQSDTGEAVWWAYASLIFDGYQASPTLILPVEVTGDTPNRTVTITYTAVSQPTQPTQPSRPVDPFNPNPINPITPAEPNDNPVSPISPVEPNVPNNTVSPTNPVEPTEPATKPINVIYQYNNGEISRNLYRPAGSGSAAGLNSFVQDNVPAGYRITEKLSDRDLNNSQGDVVIQVVPITYQKLVLYIGRNGRVVKRAYITVNEGKDSLAELTRLAQAESKMPNGYKASGKIKKVAKHLNVWVGKKKQPSFNRAPKTKDVLYVAADGKIVKKTRITGKVNKKNAQSKLSKGYKIAGIDRVNNHYNVWIKKINK